VVTGGRKSPWINETKFYQIPVINNCYEVLADTGLQEPHELKHKGKHRVRKGYKDKNKILILGDSQGKGIAKEVQYNLRQDFEVQAIMKPGANTESTVNTTNSDVTGLTKEDVCIIWGGTSDVGKNETEVGLCLGK
jgi:hypothetical protein